MAYNNFQPMVWAAGIERALERLCVFAEDCNRKYEGTVNEKGESVKILGVGKPTIRTLDRKNASGNIVGAEEIEDTSVIMPINQIRYFNYMVGDIDKAQGVNGIMDALSEETSEGLANSVDTYIADLAKDSNVIKATSTVQTVVANETTTSGQIYVLDLLDTAIQKLYENDVSPSTEIVCTISPRFWKLFKRAYIKLDSDNSKMIKNGKVAMYGNVTIKMSNNVAKDASGNDLIMMRTKRAIAYVQPKTHTEPYRPENKFADAVKGYILFDAKVVRPKEMVVINAGY